jgi:hypothetical protein
MLQLALLLFPPTLSDLQKLKLHQRPNFIWNLVMFVLFLALVTFLSTCLYDFWRSQKPTAIPQDE